MASERLLRQTDRGLYCEIGDFYVDPWRPVDRAVITHAHSDHLRWGMKSYLCSKEGEGVTRLRTGPDADISTLDWGQPIDMGGARVSLHPAGHILGSAQVRIEAGGEVAVVSGDYKTGPDKTCTPFEPVRCHTFVTESTFGLPIYRWEPEEVIAAQLNEWWAGNREAGRCSLVLGYALGKSQRALSMLDRDGGPIYVHGALVRLTEAYREAGIDLPPCLPVSEAPKGTDFSKAIVLAPPSAAGTPWTRRFGDVSDAFLSGWMAIRGARRRRAVDRGFVLSDHVDWPSLLGAIDATGAEEVWVTHGYSATVVRYLNDLGKRARVLTTAWENDEDAEEGE